MLSFLIKHLMLWFDTKWTVSLSHLQQHNSNIGSCTYFVQSKDRSTDQLVSIIQLYVAKSSLIGHRTTRTHVSCKFRCTHHRTSKGKTPPPISICRISGRAWIRKKTEFNGFLRIRLLSKLPMRLSVYFHNSLSERTYLLFCFISVRQFILAFSQSCSWCSFNSQLTINGRLESQKSPFCWRDPYLCLSKLL